MQTIIKIDPNSSLEGFLVYAERKRIQEALLSTDCNLIDVSKILRISINDLVAKIYRLNLGYLLLSDEERIARAEKREKKSVFEIQTACSIIPKDVNFEKNPVGGGFVSDKCIAPNCESGDFQPLSLAQIDFLLVSNNKNDQDEFKLEKSFLECEDEEKERILREVINRAGGNVNEASRMLEMSASTVHLYIKKLDFSSFVKEERSKSKRKF